MGLYEKDTLKLASNLDVFHEESQESILDHSQFGTRLYHKKSLNQ